MNIKILGSGCPSCIRLEQNTQEAVKNLGIDAVIEKVTDMNDIMDYGITRTPALVVDETVKSSGKVLNTTEIADLLKE